MQLAVHCRLDRFVRPYSALRELPTAAAAPARDQHAAGPVDQDDPDVRAEAVFVDEIHVRIDSFTSADALQKPSASL
jgi:hypothetical protein